MYGPPEYYGPPDPPDEEAVMEAVRLRHIEYYEDLDVPLTTEDEEVIEATEI